LIGRKLLGGQAREIIATASGTIVNVNRGRRKDGVAIDVASTRGRAPVGGVIGASR
jgi:hypothetical protein